MFQNNYNLLLINFQIANKVTTRLHITTIFSLQLMYGKVQAYANATVMTTDKANEL